MRVHRVSHVDAPTDMQRSQQIGRGADLMLFAVHRALGHHRPRLDLRQREQMHRGLMGCLMAERPTHGLAIHRTLGFVLAPPPVGLSG